MKVFNKFALHKFRILETLEAGIVLSGGEVKSVRANRVDLKQSFVKIQNNELYLKNAYLYPLPGQAPLDYQPNHDRKLLLHRSQINSLIGKLSKSGMNLFPLSLYTTRNLVKVELALGQSKTKIDKRKIIKLRDEQRKIEQELRGEKRI